MHALGAHKGTHWDAARAHAGTGGHESRLTAPSAISARVPGALLDTSTRVRGGMLGETAG